MSKKSDKLLTIDHSNRIIIQNRQLNPPSYNARYLDKLRENNPDYEIIKKY